MVGGEKKKIQKETQNKIKFKQKRKWLTNRQDLS